MGILQKNKINKQHNLFNGSYKKLKLNINQMLVIKNQVLGIISKYYMLNNVLLSNNFLNSGNKLRKFNNNFNSVLTIYFYFKQYFLNLTYMLATLKSMPNIRLLYTTVFLNNLKNKTHFK